MPLNEPKEIPFKPSTIETIDVAVYEWINDHLNLHAMTNKGWRKTPVIWQSAERAHHIKNNKDIRDASGALILPLISVERTTMTKDFVNKGSAFGNIPREGDGGSIVVSRRLKQDKTSNFANAKSLRNRGQINFPEVAGKVIQEVIRIPMPTYVQVTYSIHLKTEYQQQLNQLVTPFITRTGAINYFVVEKNGHKFEAFIDSDFTGETTASSLGDEERVFETAVDINVLGYLIGEDVNQTTPKMVITESTVGVKFQRERAVLEDERKHIGDSGEYRP